MCQTSFPSPIRAPRSAWSARIVVHGCLLVGLLAGETAAQFTPGTPGRRGGEVTADQLVRVRTTSDRAAVSPGETFHVVVEFEINPKWRMYWKNPGEGGTLPPSVDVKSADGFAVGVVQWTRPKRYDSSIGEAFCYEKQFALFVPVTVPSEFDVASKDRAALNVDVRFPVCNAERCLFGRSIQNVAVRLTGSPQREAESGESAASVERHRRKLPRPIDDRNDASIALNENAILITGPAHGLDRAIFFPYDTPGVEYGSPVFTFEEDRFSVSVPLKIDPNNFTGGPPKVGGLVALGGDDTDPSYEGAVALSP